MPVKRVIFTAVKPGNRLSYALRADVPEGAEVPRRDYHSSYGDPHDPDQKAIMAGRVVEEIRERRALPETGETNERAWERIQRQLETEWEGFRRDHERKLVRSKALGRYWDGEEWRTAHAG